MVSDRRGGLGHPVLYSHPETGKRTMCFHLGMTEGFVIDKGKPILRDLQGWSKAWTYWLREPASWFPLMRVRFHTT